MKKIFVIFAIFILSGFASADPEHFLTPSISCTEKGCPPEAPCCNDCQFNGWVEKEHNIRAVSKNALKPFPACKPDGCGTCPVTLLQAQGKMDNIKKPKVLYVTSWNNYMSPVLPKIYSEDSVIAPPGFPVNDPQVSEEERKKAVDAWMKDMKKQSDENMEKLKKENPEQYQKLEQFMNMLKNAEPAK